MHNKARALNRDHLMVREEIKTELLQIKNEMTRWTKLENKAEMEIDFENIETRLRQLLAEIVKIPTSDRTDLDQIITEFRKDMEERYAITKQKIDEARAESEQLKKRTRAAKAYSNK